MTTVSGATRSYRVTRDRTIVSTAHVVGRVVDELTGDEPGTPIEVRARVRGLADPPPGAGFEGRVTVASGAWFALSGSSELLFPDLATTGYEATITVTAPGYVPVEVPVLIPMGSSSFPLTAAPTALRRTAVRLQGRVMALNAVPPGPPPAIQRVAVVDPPGLVAFEAPFQNTHDAGAAVEGVQLAPTGAQTGLLRNADPGAADLLVMSRLTVAAGVALEIISPQRVEHAIVAAVEGPPDLSRPGRLLLEAPLRFHHPRDTAGVAVNAIVPGAGTTLTSPAVRGEQAAFVVDPTVLLDGQLCRAGGALADAELLSVLRLERDMDPDGYFDLGPVARASRIQLDITPAAETRHHIVDYDQATNFVELRI